MLIWQDWAVWLELPVGLGAGRTRPPWQALEVVGGMKKQLGDRQRTNDCCLWPTDAAVW